MPGHKRRGSDIGAELDPYAIDITEIDNLTICTTLRAL